MSQARLRALRAMRNPRSYGEDETNELAGHLSKSLDPDNFRESEEPEHRESSVAKDYMASSGFRNAMRDLDSSVGRSADRLTGNRPEEHPADSYGRAETDDLDRRLKKSLDPRRLAVK